MLVGSGLWGGVTAAALLLAGALTLTVDGRQELAIVLLASGVGMGLMGSALSWAAPRQHPSILQGDVVTPRVASDAAAEWLEANGADVVRVLD
ncbi:hypothetical protein Prum_071580 [Phytohabitans rumicis]|uniref:Uncharacterized protein n=1 Tax=Phytohabitans rumicis TaxID=1076125 RepID=A0A6V8LHD7_9ACTN|nr:hypothetical protein Prum_071580 [Phytohabitans rumicis]